MVARLGSKRSRTFKNTEIIFVESPKLSNFVKDFPDNDPLNTRESLWSKMIFSASSGGSKKKPVFHQGNQGSIFHYQVSQYENQQTDLKKYWFYLSKFYRQTHYP